jgi:DNA-directed RNA polymerase alpha subunit
MDEAVDLQHLLYHLTTAERSIKIIRELVSAMQPPKVEAMPEVLARPIGDLELSTRGQRCLELMLGKHASVGDILKVSERDLLREPNFGRKSLRELREVLHYYGLRMTP